MWLAVPQQMAPGARVEAEAAKLEGCTVGWAGLQVPAAAKAEAADSLRGVLAAGGAVAYVAVLGEGAEWMVAAGAVM